MFHGLAKLPRIDWMSGRYDGYGLHHSTDGSVALIRHDHSVVCSFGLGAYGDLPMEEIRRAMEEDE